MSPLPKPIEEYERVKVWFDDFEKSWGDGSDAAASGQLAILSEFCEFVGKDPDAIVADLLAPVEGGEKIRYKARHRYIELIAEFEATNPGGRPAGNAIRSFLIHNGVAVGTRIVR